MTRMVGKYSVDSGLFTRDIPKGSKILSVRWQVSQPQMWVLVDPMEETEERQFVAIGTGHKHEVLDLSIKFIGTFINPGFNEVYHLFEIDKT